MIKNPHRPADDGPGISRLRRDERFEKLRLDTLRKQQEALDDAANARLARAFNDSSKLGR